MLSIALPGDFIVIQANNLEPAMSQLMARYQQSKVLLEDPQQI